MLINFVDATNDANHYTKPPTHLYRRRCLESVVIVLVLTKATRETVEMTRRMSDAGADAVLVITPCFYKNAMNKDTLYRHFHSVGCHSHLYRPH